VVFVDARPGEGEGGAKGLETFLGGELGGGTSDWGRRVRREGVGLPLVPQPGLRGARRKLTELRTRGAEGNVKKPSTTIQSQNISEARLQHEGQMLRSSGSHRQISLIQHVITRNMEI